MYENLYARSIQSTTLLCLVSMLLASCGSDPGYNAREDFIRTEGAVQFVNLMPDSPEVTIIHELNQNQVSFPFVTSPEPRVVDRYDWEIAYLGSSNNRVTIAEGENQQISENVLSTFLIGGSIAQPNVQVVDHALLPIEERPEDEASIWFASNLSQYSMVDIYLTRGDQGLESPLLSLTSGTFTALVTVLPAADSRLRITRAATDEVLFDSGTISIGAQTLELFALVDDFGPDASEHVNVIRTLSTARTTIPDVSQENRLRVANLSTTPAIAVTGGSLSSGDVARGDRSSYLVASAGTQTLNVSGNAEGEDPVLLEEKAVNLPAGTYGTLLIFDDPSGDSPVTSVTIRDQYRQVEDRALFQFVNGSGELIDFFALRGGESQTNTAPAFNDIGFNTSTIVEVPTGEVRFIATNSTQEETLAEAQLTLTEGNTYTVVMDTEGVIYTFVN